MQDIRRDLQSGHSLTTSLFSKTVTQDDVACITNFMNQCKQGIPTGQAWAATMKNATVAGKRAAVQVKTGAVDINTLTQATNTSRLAMIGMQAATIALNMALTMGISVAIQGIITLFNNLAHAAKKASEAADEAKAKATDTAKKSAEEVKQLQDLIAQYKELAKGDKTDVSNREKILDIQNQITTIVGEQAGNVDLVNGNLDEELAKLNEILAKQAEINYQNAQGAYIAARDAANKATGQYSIALADEYEYVGSIPSDAKSALKAAGYGEALFGGTGFKTGIRMANYTENGFNEMNGFDISTIEGRIAALQDMIDTLQAAGMANTTFYNGLIEARNHYQGYVNDVDSSAKSLIESAVAMSRYDSTLSKMVVDSAESFEKYRDSVVDLLLDDVNISEMITTGVLDEDTLRSQVASYMSVLYEFSDGYNAWYQSQLTQQARERNLGTLTQKLMEGKDPRGGSNVRKALEQLTDEELSVGIQLVLDNDYNTVDELKAAIDEIIASGQQYVTMQNRISFSDLLDDEGFTEEVDTYIENVEKLGNALEKLHDGSFDNSDFIELVKLFPELAGDADNLESAITSLVSNMKGNMVSSFASQFGKMKTDGDITALRNFKDAVLELGDVVGNTAFAIDIDVEKESAQNLLTAIKESASATGLSADSVQNLKERYKDLKEFNPAQLFEETVNGIHLNTSALRELESAYRSQKKQDLKDQLDGLVNEYNNLTDAINNSADAKEQMELLSKRTELGKQIEDVATLAAMYEGLTSSYNMWLDAQSTTDENDMFLKLSNGIEDMKTAYSEGWVGTDDFRSFVQMMTDTDMIAASTDQILAMYEKGLPTMERFFNGSTGGLQDFLDVALDVSNKLGKNWVTLGEDGTYNFDFGVGGDTDLVNAINEMTDLQMSTQQVQILLRALQAAGFDINLDTALSDLDLLNTKAEEANNKLLALGKTDVTFDFNADIGGIGEEIEKAQQLLNTFKSADGTVDLTIEGAQEAQDILVALITRKQLLNQPAIMNVDTSGAEDNISNCINMLQNFQSNYNDLEIDTAVGVDTSTAQTNIQNIISQLSQLDSETQASLGLDDAEFQAALSAIMATEVDVNAGINLPEDALAVVQSTIAGINPEILTTINIDSSAPDGYQPEDKNATVHYSVDASGVYRWGAPNKSASVNYSANSYYINTWTPPVKYGTVYYTASYSGNSRYRGTARVDGTAFKSGTWGAKNSGDALGGELGRELVVRNGKYFTIGDDGAEFFKYRKGDIIFNHKQTEEILKNGRITSRGRAMADGTVGGDAYSSGSGRIVGTGSVSRTGSGGGSGGSGSSSSADEFEEVIDWIEIAIDRIEREISRLDLKAQSVFRSWTERTSNLRSEISAVTEEMKVQSAGYYRYIQEANSVGLSETWARKVRDGTIDIQHIYDEDLANKIREYQEWYEKALDCRDALDELRESQSELYKQLFDNVVTRYDGLIQVIETEKSIIEEFISQQEAQGHIISAEYYRALQSRERDNIEQLRKEKDSLVAALNETLSSGAVEKGSEAYYDMVNQINDVTLAIEESNTAILEYDKSIREIGWQVFDLIQKRISQITSEADFLIELMENDKLYDSRGQLTDEGTATMGLHGLNYNVYMEQAKKYADEIKRLNREITDDPYNQDLIDRRNELLELQQESILAAEDEKMAIRDMVEEGIERELDSLKELISTYNDALDSQKDLYDYQKKIAKQTQEVASLQKQLAAYENDNSEENRARLQQLRVSLGEAQENLQETQYDRYISDQKKLLDELYSEYETILNMRLDDIDALIRDMTAEINDSASLIGTTIGDAADRVGYTISNDLSAMWSSSLDGALSAIQVYGTDVKTGLTNVQVVLSNLNSNVINMVGTLDLIAGSKTNGVNSTAGIVDSTPSGNTNTIPSYTPAPSSGGSYGGGSSGSGSGSGSNNSWGSWFIKKRDSYPKNQLNINTSIIDRLKYFDFDSSNSARATYFSKMGGSGTYVGSASQNVWMINQMKSHGYKNGVLNLANSELAWTQEGRKQEYIVRPSDGAILTPLAKQDSVFSANASTNLWNMANNPSDFIRDNLKIGNNITPVIKSVSGDTFTGDIAFTVSLPNVMNYEQFKYAMQHDKSFERFVRAMTVDKMFGGSSLRKYN